MVAAFAHLAAGAGLSIVQTSGFVVPMQMGAFAGYVAFGWLADKLGRRPAFVCYVLAAAILNFHPLRNDRTSAIVANDLLKFVRACGQSPRVIALPEASS